MPPGEDSKNLFTLKRSQAWVTTILWTLCVLDSLLWNLHEQNDKLIRLASNTAEVTFENDVRYRRWAARQGGVYVRVSDDVHPNSYLKVPDRDVTTDSGIALTLVNPAYMARMVNELDGDSGASRGHITSLKPIRPENGPDDWEASALRAFEKGSKEVSSLQWMRGGEYLRIMRPFVTEQFCLKCHAAQGYKVGDIRGGISVSVAMAPLRAVAQPQATLLVLAHLSLWLVGMIGLGRAARALGRHLRAREEAENALRQARDSLELRVEERTAELSRMVDTLHTEVAQRTTAEEALREQSGQLRRLASELTLAEQRERQRLAQVLHDGLQQILVAAKLRLALVGRGKDVAGSASEVSDLIDDAIETSRSLTAELSPSVLRHGGLIPALEWLARWMHDKHNLTVDLTASEKIDSAPEEVAGLLFQATRELLFNVVKHAGARTARVEVTQRNGQIQITVEDDGAGFDASVVRHKTGGSGGIGLFSIRERINLLGGRMDIESAPGRGSRFKLLTPCLLPSTGSAQAHSDRGAKVSVVIGSQTPTEGVRTMEKIRVVLADDHMVVRQGLAGLLRALPDIEVVGEASDGESAVRVVRDSRPHVLLLDINMPGMNGVEATRIIHKELPHVNIIGLSMFEDQPQTAAMIEAGAVQFLTKSGPSEAVIAAIRACKPHVA